MTRLRRSGTQGVRHLSRDALSVTLNAVTVVGNPCPGAQRRNCDQPLTRGVSLRETRRFATVVRSTMRRVKGQDNLVLERSEGSGVGDGGGLTTLLLAGSERIRLLRCWNCRVDAPTYFY